MDLRGDGRAGFSLMELLVVMAIIALLAGLVLTAAMNSRKKAQQTYCLNNIRQLALDQSGQVSLGDSRVGSCPAGCEYANNRYVKNVSLVGDAPGTVLLFESDTSAAGDESSVVRRHLGGANFAFCDGHAKWSKETPNFRP